jgi:hypothetical protein
VVAVVLSAFGAALAGAGDASADTVLASGLPRAPKVSADKQVLAWSEYDRSISAWRLTVLSNGIARVLPVAPSSLPFDVDLGDDGHGGIVATYSRCAQPPAANLPPRCRLYVYDLSTAAERPIAVADAAGASQFLPSMAAGRVAFVRVDAGRPVGPRNPRRIYVQSLDGGKPKLLPGGIETSGSAGLPTALDLGPSSLAFTWDGPDGSEFPDGTSELRLDGLAGGQTLVRLAAEDEIQIVSVLGPTLVSGGVRYAISGGGDETFSELDSFGFPGAQRGAAVAPEGIQDVASGSAGTIYSRCLPATIIPQPGGSSCEVALAQPPQYRDVDSVVATTARPTTISAYRGNWIAFSAYEPATGEYRLMLRHPNGSIAPAPVPPKTVPFDVQLGPIYGGRERSLRTALMAVYSRCDHEPRLDPTDMLPLPSTGHGCKLYRYYLGAAREATIAGRGSRYLPSVFDGELAFAQQEPGGTPALYLASLSGHGAPRRAPGGPAGANAGPRSLVLREGRIAFVWEYTRGGILHSQLRLDANGKGGVLDSTTSAHARNRELSPLFTDAGVLGWARREGAGRSWMLDYGVSGNQRVFSYLIPNPAVAFGAPHLAGSRLQGNGVIYVGRRGVDGSMSIVRLGANPAVVTQP